MVTAVRAAALLVAMVAVVTVVVAGGAGGGAAGTSVAATDARHRMEEWMSDNHTLPEVEEVRASRRRSSSEGAADGGGSGSSSSSSSSGGGGGGGGKAKAKAKGGDAEAAGAAAEAAAAEAAAAMEAGGYGASGRINRSAVTSAAQRHYDEAVRAAEAEEEEEEEAPPRYFTLVLIKPDGVERGLVGEVLSRFERKQLRFAASAVVAAPSRELVETHYDEHRKTKFFASLVEYMTSGPVHAFVVESPSDNVVDLVRLMLGPSDVLKAEPGTVRGDFAIDGQRNTVHASADRAAARREIALWFPDFEIPETPEPESSILTRIFNRVLGSSSSSSSSPQAPPPQHHHHQHSASHAYTVRASK